MPFAVVVSAVLYSVTAIAPNAVPAEIRESVICWVPVVVTALRFSVWRWTYKSAGDQAMNEIPFSLAFVEETEAQITVFVDLWLLETIRGPANVYAIANPADPA